MGGILNTGNIITSTDTGLSTAKIWVRSEIHSIALLGLPTGLYWCQFCGKNSFLPAKPQIVLILERETLVLSSIWYIKIANLIIFEFGNFIDHLYTIYYICV